LRNLIKLESNKITSVKNIYVKFKFFLLLMSLRDHHFECAFIVKNEFTTLITNINAIAIIYYKLN
jgi:hypothetical protein